MGSHGDDFEEIEATGKCKQHGAWRLMILKSFAPHATCPTCATAKREEKNRRERDEQRRNQLGRTGIPKRFLCSTFDEFMAESERQIRLLATCRDYAASCLKTGRNLVFCGPTGTGKTHLACAMVRAVSLAGGTALYTDFTSIVRRVKNSFRRGSSESETEIVSSLSGVGLLAVDELGVQLNTDFEKTLLQDLIDRRYREKRPTVVVSNLPAGEMSSLCGDRVMDRLRDDGGSLVIFDWTSWRGRV